MILLFGFAWIGDPWNFRIASLGATLRAGSMFIFDARLDSSLVRLLVGIAGNIVLL